MQDIRQIQGQCDPGPCKVDQLWSVVDCETGLLLVSLDFARLRFFSLEFYIIDQAHKQYSILGTISDNAFYLGPPGNVHEQVKKTFYEDGRRVVGERDLLIDVFLEAQRDIT